MGVATPVFMFVPMILVRIMVMLSMIVTCPTACHAAVLLLENTSACRPGEAAAIIAMVLHMHAVRRR